MLLQPNHDDGTSFSCSHVHNVGAGVWSGPLTLIICVVSAHDPCVCLSGVRMLRQQCSRHQLPAEALSSSHALLHICAHVGSSRTALKATYQTTAVTAGAHMAFRCHTVHLLLLACRCYAASASSRSLQTGSHTQGLALRNGATYHQTHTILAHARWHMLQLVLAWRQLSWLDA